MHIVGASPRLLPTISLLVFVLASPPRDLARSIVDREGESDPWFEATRRVRLNYKLVVDYRCAATGSVVWCLVGHSVAPEVQGKR